MNLKELKVKSVKKNGIKKVNDLTVDDVQHYITDNGVINHNTGLVYGASIILNMTKAKLKEGTEQTGVVVTAKPQKNRFCIPTAVKFHISYQKGMNKYVGLQEYMSWDGCGVGRGKFITEKEYSKLSDSDKELCRQHPLDKGVYYYPSDSGRYICTDYQLEAFKWSEVCSKKVWNDQALERLDNNVIKGIFSYSDSKNNDDIQNILDDDSECESDDVDEKIKKQLDD